MTQNRKASNKLLQEKSPYLLQHAYNPVDWFPWGDEAFAKAKAEDKPIFLSIGYSTCHWCHVMERESFEDAAVAKILNDNYVSIKVDREERPDIDHLYMEACIAQNGHGGWPLSAFLDHDRRPFFTGTYFPKDSRYGMTGFITILENIARLWKLRREELKAPSEDLMESMREEDNDPAEFEGISLCHKAFEQFDRSFDEDYGGFGGAPKFPSVQNLLFLLRYDKAFSNPRALEMVDKTLSSMSAGGIFDHVGGGFFRYSTDRRWLVPHFEKMMYDNAMLLIAFAEGSSIDEKHGHTARRIAGYCLSEMLGENDGFYTAQDADSEGEEGKMYLWTPDEIIQILGKEEGERFCSDYDITYTGNFEGKSIPNRIKKPPIINDSRLKKVLEEREKRVSPFKDDKILTSSNALMIAALCIAGRLLNEPDWIRQAERTAWFILGHLVKNGRLMARFRENEIRHLSTAEDYAYLCWGLFELYQATYDSQWLQQATLWNERMLSLFSGKNGGLYMSGSDVSDIPLRQKNFRDGALPSGNSVAAYNLFRLYTVTSNEKFADAAERILLSAGAEVARAPIGYSGLLCAVLQQQYGIHVKISTGEGMDELLGIVSGYRPFVITSLSDNTDSGKENAGQKATASICDRSGCHPPVEEPFQLELALNGGR